MQEVTAPQRQTIFFWGVRINDDGRKLNASRVEIEF